MPRLPRETTVDATKCHACHAKWRGVTGDQADPSASRVRSATPATQIKTTLSEVPRVPRKSAAASRATKKTQVRHQTQPCVRSATPATQNDSQVDFAKCHACHAKVPRRHGGPSASPEPAQSHKYHACHVKGKCMSPSATPAT